MNNIINNTIYAKKNNTSNNNIPLSIMQCSINIHLNKMFYLIQNVSLNHDSFFSFFIFEMSPMHMFSSLI